MSNVPAHKCALVTGAKGFVGSRLTFRLVSEGWKVHVLVRPNSDLKELVPVQSAINVEICREDQDLTKIVHDVTPDIVFHFASKFVAEHQSDQITDLIDSNIRFGTQLLEAMVQNGISRFVNAGTSWQHFSTDGYRPVCLYAATKQAFQDILEFYVDAYSLRATTLKLFDTYGPGDPRRKLISVLRSAVNSKTPIAFSEGKQLIDLVYIDDVVDAFVLAGGRMLNELTEPKEEYVVSSGTQISVKEIAEIYASVLGASLNLKWGARPYRAREVMVPWSSGKPVPGWSPKISLIEGLLRTEKSMSQTEKCRPAAGSNE